MLTETKYKKYHAQLLRKISSIANTREVNEEDEENNILPDFPIATKTALEDFESLLKKSSLAKKQYVSTFN